MVCTPVHITANIRKQLDRAEGLHQGVGCHRSNDDLCETLVNGGYHWTGVTPADIRLNRKLRGACPQCIQGKMKQRPTPDESISSPPASVGAKIWGDVERFTTKSVGGNLAAFKFYDEFSGNSTVCALPNLTVDSIVRGIVSHLAAVEYGRYGHTVHSLVMDADPVLKAVIPKLALCTPPIILKLCSPGEYAKQIENVIGHAAGRKKTFLASLSFLMPDKYSLYCDRWVADCANDQVNTSSRPSSPHILVRHMRRRPHYKYPDLSFGTVCMVRSFSDKRRELARMHNRS